MDNKKLNNRFYDVIKKIKANSKDSELASNLVSDLVSIKGQLDHKPSLLFVSLDDVVDKLEGDTFTISKLRDGRVIYHLKGGFDLICDLGLESLSMTLGNLISDGKKYKDMSEEDKLLYDSWSEIVGYVLNIPLTAFTDFDYAIEVAELSIKNIKLIYEQQMSKKLQDETPEEDMAFREAVEGLEKIKDIIKDEDKGKNEA